MNKSEDIKNLVAALVKVQAEMGAIPKDAENPFFKSKYADLAAVAKAANPVLTSNGLAISQLCDEAESAVVVETVLMHTSGQWLSSRLRMTPAKNDPQGIGSAITYARRYAFMAICGLVADEDDDGNAASTPKPQTRPSPKPSAKPNNDSAVYQKRIHSNFSALKIDEEYRRFFYKKYYKVDSSTELSPDMLKKLSNHIYFIRQTVDTLLEKGWNMTEVNEWLEENFETKMCLGLNMEAAKKAMDMAKGA